MTYCSQFCSANRSGHRISVILPIPPLCQAPTCILFFSANSCMLRLSEYHSTPFLSKSSSIRLVDHVDLRIFNSLIIFTISFIIFMFYSFFLAVRTIATTLAPFYKSPARTSRQFRSTSLAQVVVSSAFSMQATTVYFAHFFACHNVFSKIALVLSSKRSLIHLFKGIIALSQSSSRIFALGYISISKASPRPLKPDKGFSDQNSYILAPSCDFATSNRPSALVGS